MENIYCVYVHILKKDNRKYFGKALYDISNDGKTLSRWGTNGKGYTKDKDTNFAEAINEFGWDAFEHEILIKEITEEQALELESKLIILNNTTDLNYGFNTIYGKYDFLNKKSKKRQEQRKEIQKKYKQENPEKVKESQKKYETHNRNKINEKARERHQRNKEEENKRIREYRQNKRITDPEWAAKEKELRKKYKYTHGSTEKGNFKKVLHKPTGKIYDSATIASMEIGKAINYISNLIGKKMKKEQECEWEYI